MSVTEFEKVLGYDAGGRIVMALEAGVRNGKPFVMSGPASKALTYLISVAQAYEAIKDREYEAAEAILRTALPVRLQ